MSEEEKKPFLTRSTIGDGKAHRELRQRKGRNVKHGIHSAEEGIIRRDEINQGFNYDLLQGEYKELVDWLYDVDFYSDKAHEGRKVDDVIVSLTNEIFPDGMDINDLINWIKRLKEATRV